MDRPRSRTSSVEQASAVQEQDSLFELHNNLQLKCQFCADKIDANIRLLQHHLVDTHTDDTEPEAAVNGDCDVTKLTKKNEEIFLALASLKQVRDVLRGSLNLDQSATSKQAANMEIMNSKLDDLPLPPVEIPTDSSDPLSSDVKRQLSFERTDS
uniref:C2H2-type domain-containing protein n=1 Tax=Ciona savignyi TaxID=51511 RepID=H2Z5C9_CIOSA